MAAGAGGAALGRATLVLPYYGFSIGITFYKWLMKSFPFPLLVTLPHLLLTFGLSAYARALARCRSGRPRGALSWAGCLRRAAPPLSTSLDIALSNWIPIPSSLGALTLALTQRLALLLVVLLIARELFMFTSRSTQFNAQGFVLVLCASSLGRIRWTLMQILMLQNPTDTMFHLEPLMFLGLFPLFAVFEGLPLSISEKLFHFHEAGLPFSLVGKLFLGGILAFGLGFSEFLFVSRTSSLILSIAGIFKVRHGSCSLELAGLAVCLSGISLHVILKAMNSKGEKALELHKEASSEPDLELLLHHTEHVEEGEEDAETPQH
uniref:Solute carrier family 35 member C2 n=1 Tax=Falco tinnunculus TaxID=100819 RepID=A0A8C4XKB5_FALTI